MRGFERLAAFGRYATLQDPKVRESGISVDDQSTYSLADVMLVVSNGHAAGSAFRGGVRTIRAISGPELVAEAVLRDHYSSAFPFGSAADFVDPKRLGEFRVQLDGRNVQVLAAFVEGTRLGVAFRGLDGIVSLATDAPVGVDGSLAFVSRSFREAEARPDRHDGS